MYLLNSGNIYTFNKGSQRKVIDTKKKNFVSLKEKLKKFEEKYLREENKENENNTNQLRSTIFEEFNLSSNKKRKLNSIQEYKSITEKEEIFWKTPDPVPPIRTSCTQFSEFLLSKTNNRSLNISSEEKQIREINNVPKFKALKINPKIMSCNGYYGVPRVPKKETTIPHTFNLRTGKRKRAECGEIEKVVFKALPLPKYKSKLPVVKPKPLTIIKPFNLLSEALHCENKQKFKLKRKMELEMERKNREFKARPIALYKKNKVTRTEEKRVVESKPFNLKSQSLHEKSLNIFNLKLQKEEYYDKLKRQFKAKHLNKNIFIHKEIEMRKGDLIKLEKLKEERNNLKNIIESRFPEWKN